MKHSIMNSNIHKTTYSIRRYSIWGMYKGENKNICYILYEPFFIFWCWLEDVDQLDYRSTTNTPERVYLTLYLAR